MMGTILLATVGVGFALCGFGAALALGFVDATYGSPDSPNRTTKSEYAVMIGVGIVGVLIFGAAVFGW